MDYAHKQIIPDYPIHELIARRFSPRVFDAKPVGDSVLASLFEAARWAASSGNNQPWRFVVARQGEALFEVLAGCLSEGNNWAKGAPVLILAVAKLLLEREGKAPRENRYAWYELGLAVGTMSLQASAMGLYLHQMAGFDAEAARQRLEIPEGYAPVTMIAAGYLGELASAPEALREKETAPRSRYPQSAFVFSRWGTPRCWRS